MQSIASRADTPAPSEGDGSGTATADVRIPHIPVEPLALLHALHAAVAALTQAVRGHVYEAGAAGGGAAAGKEYSALNKEPSEALEEVRALCFVL